ncbi:MAG TPA: carbohydrate kinase family protein [Gaiellaceae bacterium]|jgi:sugar/nucleoside kinase (ribokinase family)
MLDFLAVGDVMLDVITTAGPAGAVHSTVRVRGGGSALNAAVWAATEGARAAVVGRIGADPAGTMVRTTLEEAGVEPRLVVDPEAATGTVVYIRDGVVADRGATARLSQHDLPRRLKARAILVSGYALLHEDTQQAARAAIERSRTDWLALDVASAELVRRAGPDRVLELASGVDVLLANEDEALELTGAGPEEAAVALGRRFRLACVKRGARGAVAWFDGETVACPAPHVLEHDVAGAGDAFAAGLLVALAAGKPLREALASGCRLGTAAAAAG